MTAVHVIVPASINDPARPSGGNVYDRQVCDGLAALGWLVHEHAMSGDWPRPDAAARSALTEQLAGLADGAIVLIDGIIASAAAGLPAFAPRLRLVVLVHLPLAVDRPLSGDDRDETRAVERATLAAAAAVVTTSEWTKNWLVGQYGLEPGRVHAVEPGTAAAELAPGTTSGGELLCVAAVTPTKGYDVLISALAGIADLSWRCVCVGAVDLDPSFVDRVIRRSEQGGIAGRVRFVGTRTGAALAVTYATADVVVLGSRAETYGMVVTEALARGIPVIATAVGGVPEALGSGADGVRPGILVPPDDALAFAAALRHWLGDADLRLRLRRAARQRRGDLPDWTTTAVRLSAVLARVGGDMT